MGQVVDFTKETPGAFVGALTVRECPVCRRPCVVVPDTLTDGNIYVHSMIRHVVGMVEFTNRCLPASPSKDGSEDR